ncbi:MAG: hypothetical protein C5B54_12145, partial [Acidobacteria bacterium]
DKKLQCNSGSWAYVSTSTSTLDDTTGWTPVGNFDVNQESAKALTAVITDALNSLNSQPGAQNAE